ncbi:hypothetical protein DL95DRAFT_415219 [Leptodontidium sp. 2 PMI_412]|nr:hypothetical protein DL95DRAFT_415219 [Leptodontidium sp. 2 PMI_412]
MTSADKVQPMPPAHLVHVVLRTNKFKTMVQYYKDFLGAHSSYENERLAFLQYDYEHHRIAIINLPDDAPVPAAGSALGFLPTKCLNHGPTTSMYYTDPDGNRIEVQVDNYKTAEEASAFMAGPEFARNPIGANFDPEEFCRRVESGEDHESIKKRVEVGARNIGDP